MSSLSNPTYTSFFAHTLVKPDEKICSKVGILYIGSLVYKYVIELLLGSQAIKEVLREQFHCT